MKKIRLFPSSVQIQIDAEFSKPRFNGGSESLSHFGVGDKTANKKKAEERRSGHASNQVQTTYREKQKEMVLNSSVVVTVANVSANLCQYIACNPERLPNDQVLHLLFCFPFQHVRRFALSAWACLFFPAGDYSTSASSSSFSSSYGSDSDLASGYRDDLHSD